MWDFGAGKFPKPGEKDSLAERGGFELSLPFIEHFFWEVQGLS
jgi:hypothetical protein